MKLVTAVIRPAMLGDVKAALTAYGILDMVVTPSFGRHDAGSEACGGIGSGVGHVPMARVDVAVERFDAEDVATVMAAAARTGMGGDGEVRIGGADRVIRIGGGQLCWNGG